MTTRTKHQPQPPPDLKYLSRIPRVVPDGLVLVHNFRPGPEQLGNIGLNGFRAWYSQPDPKLWVACSCPFAPAVETHYTTKALT